MKAAWYEKQGAARDVLALGKMDDPQPHAGEVRIRGAFSGVNPGDVKKREDAFGVGMPYPRVIPHSDGSGTVDAVGEGVSREWIGRRVWCYGAQSYRPFGTAAEYTVVPLKLVVQLPENVPLEQGACFGIPGITAHRAVHVAGSVVGQTVLVQGGAGAVGACAVQLAHQAGARVIATCRTESDKGIASRAGADEVLLTTGNLAEGVRALAPDGVNHIVEVAFGANIKTDTELLAPMINCSGFISLLVQKKSSAPLFGMRSFVGTSNTADWVCLVHAARIGLTFVKGLALAAPHGEELRLQRARSGGDVRE